MRAQLWHSQLLPETLQAVSLQARPAGTSTTTDLSQRVEKNSAPSCHSTFILLSWDSPLSETGIKRSTFLWLLRAPTQSRICHKKVPWEHKPFLFISLYYYHINGTFTGRMDAQVPRKHSWLFPAPPREQGTLPTNPRENYGRVPGTDTTIGSFL